MQTQLTRRDWLGLSAFTLTLYFAVLAVGGPLTMHEGVLSQTSRAMFANHDWLIPQYGNAPWVERPPLPQWLTCGLGALLGGLESEWIVRIGPALAGTATVLMTAWLGAAFFGRGMGILSALILATMYQFVRYSTLAEADMFLAPLVAGVLCLFAYLEILRPRSDRESIHFLGVRPWPVLDFFVLVGMTNLVKGLVFGAMMALAPIGFYLLIHFSVRGIGRYFWLWGWLVSLGIALAWPWAVMQRLPEALEVWRYDLLGRLHGGYLAEPAWYYFVSLFWILMPWTFFAVVGLKLTGSRVWQRALSPERLLWCWAIAPPLIFSFSQGKHHHYMIHFMAPWAILSGLGLARCWQELGSVSSRRWWPALAVVVAGEAALAWASFHLPGPDWFQPALLMAWPALVLAVFALWRQQDARIALTGGFALLAFLYMVGFTYKSAYLHRSNDDTAFLRQARQHVPAQEKLLLHPTMEALEGLRMLFYMGDNVLFLHNLTFLPDENLQTSEVYLVTRYKDLEEVEKYGQAEMLLQSKKSRREESPADRWTLFRVRFRADLTRKNTRVLISPMQAMYREPGPDLK